MNSCNFIGRIGRDAESKTIGQNQVANWPIAVDVGYGDNKSTLWIDCALWGERAPKLAGMLRKGDNVGVSGSISLREYQAKDGSTKTTVVLRVGDVKLLGTKPQQEEPRQTRSNAAPQPAPAEAEFQDDDIPF